MAIICQGKNENKGIGMTAREERDGTVIHFPF